MLAWHQAKAEWVALTRDLLHLLQLGQGVSTAFRHPVRHAPHAGAVTGCFRNAQKLLAMLPQLQKLQEEEH